MLPMRASSCPAQAASVRSPARVAPRRAGNREGMYRPCDAESKNRQYDGQRQARRQNRSAPRCPPTRGSARLPAWSRCRVEPEPMLPPSSMRRPETCRPRRMWRRMGLVIGIAAGFYLAALLALFVFQRSLLYVPNTGAPSLAEAGLEGVMESVQIKTADGLRLLSWC